MIYRMKKTIYFRTNIGVFLRLQSNIFTKKALFFRILQIVCGEKYFLPLLLPTLINKFLSYLISIFLRYTSDSNIKKDIFLAKKGTFFAKDDTLVYILQV